MKTSYVCNVAIDLEFTPVPRDLQRDGLRQEIIEVGAVKLAADGSVAGECAAHKRAVAEKLSQGKKECAASLGEQCDGLAALLAQLRAKEAA